MCEFVGWISVILQYDAFTEQIIIEKLLFFQASSDPSAKNLH